MFRLAIIMFQLMDRFYGLLGSIGIIKRIPEYSDLPDCDTWFKTPELSLEYVKLSTAYAQLAALSTSRRDIEYYRHCAKKAMDDAMNHYNEEYYYAKQGYRYDSLR